MATILHNRHHPQHAAAQKVTLRGFAAGDIVLFIMHEYPDIHVLSASQGDGAPHPCDVPPGNTATVPGQGGGLAAYLAFNHGEPCQVSA